MVAFSPFLLFALFFFFCRVRFSWKGWVEEEVVRANAPNSGASCGSDMVEDDTIRYMF